MSGPVVQQVLMPLLDPQEAEQHGPNAACLLSTAPNVQGAVDDAGNLLVILAIPLDPNVFRLAATRLMTPQQKLQQLVTVISRAGPPSARLFVNRDALTDAARANLERAEAVQAAGVAHLPPAGTPPEDN